MPSAKVKQLYRTGHLGKAAAMAGQIDPGSSEEAREVIYGVQALLEMGKFSAAAMLGITAASHSQAPEAAVLKVQAAYARMMASPCHEAREAVRTESAALLRQQDAYSQAMATRWETRMQALEITLCLRSLRQLPEVNAGFAAAADQFRAAGCAEEARGEMLQMADRIRKGPPAAPTKAIAILEPLRDEALAAADWPAVAKASLALAELGFETLMGGAKAAPESMLRNALETFEQVKTDYHKAAMAHGPAEVQASLGRLLMHYGMSSGADCLHEAAQLWEETGHLAAADGAWRDLLVWHSHRADREHVEALEARLGATGTAIDSTLTAVTGNVQAIHSAFVRGDFAAASEISVLTRSMALEPGQAVASMLIECAALMGRGARKEAAKLAADAVAMLRPVAPCLLLGDALFQLGTTQEEMAETINLWEEAARADLDCGLPVSAAQRHMNIAEVLSQSAGKAVSSDGRSPDDFFTQAESLLGSSRDLESIILRGNIAQRRGLAALRNRDFAACGQCLTEAENNFRAVGRNADLAFTLGQQGLALFQIARHNRSQETCLAALGRFEEASTLFQRQDLLGEQFRMERLTGAAAWEAGNLAPDEERAQLYESASRHMHAAASLMEFLRKGRQEKGLFDRQNSLDDIAATMEPFLEEAFRFHLTVLQRPAEALGWLEKGKARGLLDSISTSKTWQPPPDVDATLAVEETRLEQERRSITKDSYSARKRWKQLTAQLESLWTTMSSQPASAAYASLRRGLSLDWSRWQQALQEQSTLPAAAGRPVLSVHFVWPRNNGAPIRLIACRGGWAEPRIAEVSLSPRKIESFLHSCFSNPDRSSLAQWLRMTGGDATWQRGFAPLIAPLEKWAAPGDVLLLIPHGPLHSFPLNALLLGGVPLAERNPLSFAPSAALLMVCWQRQAGRAGEKCSVLACPDPGPGFPPLAQAAGEAAAVAAMLGVSPVISDKMAPEVFREALSGASAVHFVGHATEAATGWDSGLQLGGGNVFTTRDFFQTSLQADIFTLAGCRTARSRRREGDEVLGLIPSLLYAGASSVLASQWEAADDATAMAMRGFYRSLLSAPHRTKADAWREAVAELRQNFPSLADWATFTLHGDWK